MQQSAIKIAMEKGSASLEMSLAADGTLLIQIAGAWLLDSGAPTFDAFSSVLEKDKGMARAVYDASRLGDWDSAALSFLVQTSQALRKRGITEDRSGLPTGLQRLIALAQAVPERAGARSDDGEILMWGFRRAAVCAGVLAVMSLAWNFHNFTPRSSAELVADSAMNMGVEP